MGTQRGLERAQAKLQHQKYLKNFKIEMKRNDAGLFVDDEGRQIRPLDFKEYLERYKQAVRDVSRMVRENKQKKIEEDSKINLDWDETA